MFGDCDSNSVRVSLGARKTTYCDEYLCAADEFSFDGVRVRDSPNAVLFGVAAAIVGPALWPHEYADFVELGSVCVRGA